MFPEQYRNQIFIARRGSWNRDRLCGYDVVVAHLDAQGNVTRRRGLPHRLPRRRQPALRRPPGRGACAARRLDAGLGRADGRDLPHHLSPVRLADLPGGGAVRRRRLPFRRRRAGCRARGGSRGASLRQLPRRGRAQPDGGHPVPRGPAAAVHHHPDDPVPRGAAPGASDAGLRPGPARPRYRGPGRAFRRPAARPAGGPSARATRRCSPRARR